MIYKRNYIFLLLVLLQSNILIANTLDNVIDSVFIISIAEVETNNNAMAIGRSGERTKYQFMPNTWRDYSNYPFHKLNGSLESQRIADEVMQLHTQRLKSYSRALNLEVNVYNMALIHNAGFGTIRNNRLLQRHRDYALRVENVYNSIINHKINE